MLASNQLLMIMEDMKNVYVSQLMAKSYDQ